jgi:alpha-beta hydrolase superfamily lysophospholipase
VEHSEGTFKGLKGLDIYHRCWSPAADPKAVLLVAHGWAEHSGRYKNIVDHFVLRGYAVCALDHRGHGRSEGKRGYVERFSDYLSDLKTFFDLVRGEYSGKKIFLVGHSMGGTVATAYTIQYQHEFDGLLLSGAGLMLGSSLSSVLIPFAWLLSRLLPKMGIMVLDASAICQDQEVVDAYVNDPLVYRGKITCRFGAEMLQMLRKIPSEARKINLPILIMHGTADRLCDPAGSRMLYERVSSEDKTLKLYDRFHHEIFNEPGCQQVMADMEAWLEARL